MTRLASGGSGDDEDGVSDDEDGSAMKWVSAVVKLLCEVKLLILS